MFDYQLTAHTAESHRQALLAEAEATRQAKATQVTRRTRTQRRRLTSRRAWVWLEYRPTIRAFSGAR